MRVEIKKLDACKRELNIEVDKERVIKKFDEVYGRLSKEVRVKGFRPGKIPRDILERNYKDLASQEVLRELIPEVCKEIAERDNLCIIDSPKISDISLDKGSLSFKATFEVKPEIEISGYKKIKLSYRRPKVSEDEIKKVIETLKEERNLEGEITDEFSHRFGYPDLKSLEEAIKMQLYLEKQNLLKRSLEEQIIQELLKMTKFIVPDSLVNKRLEELLKEEKLNLALRGVPEEQIKSKEKELRDKLKEQALEQVKVFLILERIAIKENIALDENMLRNVMEFLLKEASWKEVD